MNKIFLNRINNDLTDSQINMKVAVTLIPIAFLTFYFHEFGHWLVGEILGNKMSISLNNSSPISGSFINGSSALWSAIGGPSFTIIQALLFLIIVQRTKSIYSYSIMFFAVFSRLFSIIFGGINLQDETRISSMLNVNNFFTVTIVIGILLLILWRGTKIMKLDLKAVGYFTTLCTSAILLVIGVNTLLL